MCRPDQWKGRCESHPAIMPHKAEAPGAYFPAEPPANPTGMPPAGQMDTRESLIPITLTSENLESLAMLVTKLEDSQILSSPLSRDIFESSE